MADFDVEIIGDSPGDIQGRLDSLGAAAQTRANRALVETAEEVKEEIQDTAPYDSGDYRDSWYITQVAEDEVWILSDATEAEHAKFLILPNSHFQGNPNADLPASGIYHNVEGIAKRHQKNLNVNAADQLKRMISRFRI